jgi:S-adenosylmethionine/arginine decarboxylase-like enzyme
LHSLFADALRTLNVIGFIDHKFGEGGGVTGIFLLAKSHCSYHTYPESKYVAIDLFTCGREHINPLVAHVKERLALRESQLTFFIAHSSIDEAHAREVRRIIERVAKTDADWDAIGETAETSLRLTGRMLDAIHNEYVVLMSGAASRYSLAKSVLFPTFG